MGDFQIAASGTDARRPCPTCPDGKCPTINTTPSESQPPPHLVEKAKQAIPELFSRVRRDYTQGRYECVALDLANALCRKGHSPPAATHAIHQLIVEGKLSAHMVPTDLPSVYDEYGNRLTGDPHTWIGLPKSGPVPFNAFLVRAEESLWVWWREMGETQNEEESEDEEPRGLGRPKASYETVQKESRIAANWEQARDSGVRKSKFAEENGTTEDKLDNLLDRVAKRKRASD